MHSRYPPHPPLTALQLQVLTDLAALTVGRVGTNAPPHARVFELELALRVSEDASRRSWITLRRWRLFRYCSPAAVREQSVSAGLRRKENSISANPIRSFPRRFGAGVPGKDRKSFAGVPRDRFCNLCGGRMGRAADRVPRNSCFMMAAERPPPGGIAVDATASGNKARPANQ